ncbi:MAG: TIGR03619 family F420-dependent LLM class oxidoreductase [Solirubrobacteraceae bacterium]|nr:TIGR03619 family F420-dependent LLM class oxidoreductase [Solirubrobacteraceae bacterium]
MRLGARLPHTGDLPATVGIPAMARAIEAAGFDGLWVSDHIVMPERIESFYPFADDGVVRWPTAVDWYDALVSLALAAGVTERVTLGTAVLVLPLRHPVELAKQAASLDAAAGGRVVLGVGAGWLREEFEALGVPFPGRGGRLAEWMAIARACWSGRPPAFRSERYELPAGTLCLPVPPRGTIPLLVGGHSPAALRRAGRIGDGWLGQQAAGELDADAAAAAIGAVREAAVDAGRDPEALRMVLRIVESEGRAHEVARHLPALARAGVQEVIVDLDWEAGDHREVHDVMEHAIR